jgi:hypothetical protein
VGQRFEEYWAYPQSIYLYIGIPGFRYEFEHSLDGTGWTWLSLQAGDCSGASLSLVEKTLPSAQQKGLPPAHFGALATLMSAVMLIAGAFVSSPRIMSSTDGE